MNKSELIQWLQEGDVALAYQTNKYLLDRANHDLEDLRSQIAKEGWGAHFLSLQNNHGHWGRGFYQVKWVSSHYTLLDLRYLEMTAQPAIDRTLDLIVKENKSADGGVNPAREIKESDVCINGMFLTYACFFGIAPEALTSIVDFLVDQQMPDGGFNCRSNRSGAVHSSVHTTISVLEGIRMYHRMGYSYRLSDLLRMEGDAQEFMLAHHLYRSDRTGDMIHKSMTMLSFPSRWKHDVLRGLVYMAEAAQDGVLPDVVEGKDKRLEDPLDLLLSKRRKDGTWPVQAKHPGLVHFDMEKAGKASRWNTLRALRVLRQLAPDLYHSL